MCCMLFFQINMIQKDKSVFDYVSLFSYFCKPPQFIVFLQNTPFTLLKQILHIFLNGEEEKSKCFVVQLK